MDRIEGGWTAFQVEGPFAFDEVGIVARLSRSLADAKIGIFVISTYDTDYILVKQENADAAIDAWRADGHSVEEASGREHASTGQTGGSLGGDHDGPSG